jgi:predicted nucleic acid-binding protein
MAQADGSFVMIATPALFLEYESVLRRPEHSVVHGQSEAETDLFIATLARYTELVRINFNWRPQLADANDEFVLEAAINGTADAIVTFNVADFLPAAQDFGIEVKRPGSIIKGGLIQ